MMRKKKQKKLKKSSEKLRKAQNSSCPVVRREIRAIGQL